jgi:crossover junction endodeoxyribonuclease RuvC
MLVLGLDPGTATTGYGLIKIKSEGLEVVKFGLIETAKDGQPEKRLAQIFKELLDILEQFSPDVAAMEKLFFATNAKTAMRVGQAQGVLLLAAAKREVPIFEYAPGNIKKVVAGNGRADKIEIQKAVRKFLGAKVRKKTGQKTHFDNAADALAVALCHICLLNPGVYN